MAINGVMGSTNTIRHRAADFDFSIVKSIGYDKIVVGATYARSWTLKLLMTFAPDLVRVAFLTQICNWDNSSSSVVILIAKAVQNLSVSRKVFLKLQR